MPQLEFEDFEPRVGETVTLRAGDETLAGRLESVRRLPEHDGQPRRPFSVVIVTEQVDALSQQIFEVEIGPSDPFELFLVPIGPRDGGMAYEAVFS